MDVRSDSPTDRGDISPGLQETAYIPVRILGRGAFGEAVLYRKIQAGVRPPLCCHRNNSGRATRRAQRYGPVISQY